ncbi:MAG: DUF2080 family transposase-associated protein [Candidatus Nitrosopolaris sp.]
MKRRSTRHISEITAIASEYGNSAKIIVPRGWLGRRVIAFLHSEYTSKHPGEQSTYSTMKISRNTGVKELGLGQLYSRRGSHR